MLSSFFFPVIPNMICLHYKFLFFWSINNLLLDRSPHTSRGMLKNIGVFNLRVKLFISSHIMLNVNMPLPDFISGIVVASLLNLDWATVVLSVRSMELKQNGIPSFDIWTGQSRMSAPSDIAFSYVKSVQAG